MEVSRMSTTFVLIGGNEDIYPREPVFLAITNELDSDSRIRIFPTASSYPESTSETYCHQFESMGFTDVSVLRVLSRDDGKDSDTIEQVNQANAIFFVGGDQSRLVRKVKDTPLHSALQGRIGEDIVLSGTSAGAMAMSEVMIAGGGAGQALRKGEIPIKEGLALLPDLVLDTHFIARNRFYRLVHALSEHPSKTGIGITNDTAVMLRDESAVVIGTDVTTFLRGNGISFNNSGNLEPSGRIGVGSLELSVIPFGHKINLETFGMSKTDLPYPVTHR
ncbi:MAG: cyanophycinase [Candidatus Lokiarchaeota archaeon]|nr:cyanophycinase [Candidatus Lokiarchaeota archaeon]